MIKNIYIPVSSNTVATAAKHHLDDITLFGMTHPNLPMTNPAYYVVRMCNSRQRLKGCEMSHSVATRER